MFDHVVLVIIFLNCITIAMERPKIEPHSAVSSQMLQLCQPARLGLAVHFKVGGRAVVNIQMVQKEINTSKLKYFDLIHRSQ